MVSSMLHRPAALLGLTRTSGESAAQVRRFVVLCLWVSIVFLLGGTSRPETGSLVVLRPAAVLVLAYGLATITGAQLRHYRFPLGCALALVALHLFHLTPLPSELWSSLPGRALIGEIDQQAGLGKLWRPLSVAPDWTWNSLWATMVPISVLVVGLQLDQRRRRGLVGLLLVLGAASALLALLQILGGSESGLYLYGPGNGSADGLFANRNHQAVFLATIIPSLFVWAALPGERQGGSGRTQARRRLLMAVIAAAFLVPLVLVTGSRAGLLICIVAAAATPFLRRPDALHAKAGAKAKWPYWGIVAGLGALVLITIALGRGLAVDRLLGTEEATEGRVLMLPTVLETIKIYAPWGSGLGSFETVFQVHEPDRLLQPGLANRAHNDWLELAVTGGLPVLALLASGILAWLWKAWEVARPGASVDQDVALARLGLLILLLFALASLTDYPVRMPSLSCLAAIAILWTVPERRVRSGNQD